MLATSSAIDAICSCVARAAARPAVPTSSTRRASNISSRVNPWSAAKKRSGPSAKRGGPSGINVPEPCRACITPIACRERSPERSEGRLIPIWRARSRSGGKRSPGFRRPASISRRTCLTTCPPAALSSSGSEVVVRPFFMPQLNWFEPSYRRQRPPVKCANRSRSAWQRQHRFLGCRLVRQDASGRRLQRSLRAAAQRRSGADGGTEAGDFQTVSRHPVHLLPAGSVNRAPSCIRRAALRSIHHRVRALLGDLDGRRFGLLFIEEEGLRLTLQNQSALGSQELLGVMVKLVGLDGGEGRGPPFWIVESCVNVVVDLPTVLVAVNSAAGIYRGGLRVEKPIGHRYLMTPKLGHQSSRVAPIHAPIQQVLPVRITPGLWIKRRGWRFLVPPPRAVSVPNEPGKIDIPEHSGSDDVQIRGLIHRVVEALVADFEHSPIPRRRGEHSLSAGDVPGHHFLAQDMLASVQAPHRDVRMRPERRGNQNRLNIFLGEDVLPIPIEARFRPAVLRQAVHRPLQPFGIDVTQGPEVDEFLATLAQQQPAFIARSNHRGLDGPTSKRTFQRNGGAQGGQCRSTDEGFQEISSTYRFLFWGQSHESKVES